MENLSTGLFIKGSWLSKEKKFKVLNPADGSVLAEVSDADADDARQAITAASTALISWQKDSPQERARLLKLWSTEIRNNSKSLAELLTKEQGKVLSEAEGEILHSANLVDWAADEGQRIHGQTLASHDNSVRNFTIKNAVGVVAAITPWNFPAAAVLVKCASALAAGCTVVLKPSDETPLVSLAFAKLSKKAGIPEGCLNVVPCKDPKNVGDVLLSDPRVKLISFTGSTQVGKKIYATASGTMKRLSMELGGNAPYIVFDDADINLAVEQAIGARFYNSGQICVGANRFLVHQEISKQYIETLRSKVTELKVGDGFDDVNYGPLINQKAKDKLQRLIDDAVSKGAKIECGGESLGNSLFYKPTVISSVTHEMAISQEELFGPVVCIYEFENESEALSLANSTPSGLAAYVFSSSHKRLWDFAEHLEFGMIGANTSNIFSLDLAFAGVKESGMGREGGLGCLDDFLITKNFSLGMN